MSDEKRAYNIRAIRDLLQTAFNVEQLRGLFSFAKNHDLRPVADEFTPEDSKPAMVRKAVEYCQSRFLLDQLLAEIKDANPRAYERFEKELPVSVAKTDEADAVPEGAPEGSARWRMHRQRLDLALRQTRPALRAISAFPHFIRHLQALRPAPRAESNTRESHPPDTHEEYAAYRLVAVVGEILHNFRYLKELDAKLIDSGFDTDQGRRIEDQIVRVEQALSDLGLWRLYQQQLVGAWEEMERQESRVTPFRVSWGSFEPFAPWSYRLIHEFLEGSSKPIGERGGMPDGINEHLPWFSYTFQHIGDRALRLTSSLVELEPQVADVYDWITDRLKVQADSIVD